MSEEVPRLEQLDKSFYLQEYEVDCVFGKYRLRPIKVFLTKRFTPRKTLRIQVIGVFMCPDGFTAEKELYRAEIPIDPARMPLDFVLKLFEYSKEKV